MPSDAMPLGLAGSNTLKLQPVYRLACTSDQWNEKLRHIVIKHLSDPHGQSKNQIYATDAPMQERLNDWAAQHGYPNPEGRGTNRCPVRLLSNSPEAIASMSRRMQDGPMLRCQCDAWRPKTEREAAKDELAWPPLDADDERYFIGDALWHEYRDEQRTGNGKTWTAHVRSGSREVVCNPYKCPYAQGKDPKTGVARPKACKPVTEIRFALGDWASGQVAVCHAESWSTAQAFYGSLFLLLHATGGNVAGVQVDLVLDYTKPRNTPGGGKVRQPYWTVQVPFGMTEDEFRAAAIAHAEKLVADSNRLAALNQMQAQAMLIGGLPAHQGALLREFRPEAALPPAPEPETGPLNATEQQAVEDLVHGHGFAPEAADAMVRANADNLEDMYDRLPDAGRPEEPPTLEGEVLPDEDEEPTEPEGMFGEQPTTLKAIADRFLQLGEVEMGKAILQTTRANLREQMGEAATGEALVLAYCAAAEEWWAREGRMAHSGGGEQ